MPSKLFLGLNLRNHLHFLINVGFGDYRSFYMAIPWVLFENIMSFHRTKALMIGLFEAKRANEWIVTEKLGDAFEGKSRAEFSAPKGPRQLKHLRERYVYDYIASHDTVIYESIT